MHFLVTGGAGFIGSHVCERLLQNGHSVWAFDDLNPFYDPKLKRKNLQSLSENVGQASSLPVHGASLPRVSEGRLPLEPADKMSAPQLQTGSPALADSSRHFVFRQGDLTNRAALDELMGATRFDQIIHLAARAGVRPSLEEPALYQRVNVEGTVNLLEAACAHGVKKVIMASSSSVYGVNSKVPFSECDAIFSAISPYAASKLACEALGHVYHHVYGLDVVMLRFFTVYGPRQRPDLAIHKFARLIDAGQPIPVFGDGSAARDYTYVTDTVDGVMACTQKEFGYEIFNLGESQTVTLSRLIELLEAALGTKAVLNRQPNQPGDVPITYADISKARSRLGYNPGVKIEQGIRLFVEWFRSSQ